MEKLTDRKNISSGLVSNTTFQAVFMGIVVVGAFFLGSLWTKVQILEKGSTGGSPSAANVPAGNNAPAAPAPQAAAVAPKIDKNDHIRGNKNARIALVEYSDLECPFCKTFHPTAQKVVDEYNGKVMWVYRHYPLSFHANAQKEAEAAECVYDQGGDDAFWKFIDAIYTRTTSNGTGFALDKLGPLATEVGVSEATFTQCLDSGKFAQKVKDSETQGTKEGVTGTPGNILLNTKTGKTQAIPGAVPFEQIKPVLDDMLK